MEPGARENYREDLVPRFVKCTNSAQGQAHQTGHVTIATPARTARSKGLGGGCPAPPPYFQHPQDGLGDRKLRLHF